MAQRVVVSLTTTPSRVAHLATVIDSIAKQTLRPDAIYVNVPYFSLKGEPYQIPANYLEECQIFSPTQLIIQRLENDLGPISKLVPTLSREKHPLTRIVTVDDDMIYSPHFLQRLNDCFNRTAFLPKESIEIICGFCQTQRRKAAVSMSGWVVGNFPASFERVFGLADIAVANPEIHNRSVDWIEGTHGIMYQRDFFPDDGQELLAYRFKNKPDWLSKLLLMNDDHLISLYLRSKCIDLQVDTASEMRQHARDNSKLNNSHGSISVQPQFMNDVMKIAKAGKQMLLYRQYVENVTMCASFQGLVGIIGLCLLVFGLWKKKWLFALVGAGLIGGAVFMYVRMRAHGPGS